MSDRQTHLALPSFVQGDDSSLNGYACIPTNAHQDYIDRKSHSFYITHIVPFVFKVGSLTYTSAAAINAKEPNNGASVT